MYIDAQTIIIAGAVAGAIITLGGILVSVVKWFLLQNKQTEDISNLRTQHLKDIEVIKESEKQDLQEVKEELCVLSYCMLATLDGLKQLNCNGNVSDAYEKLSKHLNKKAHN